MSILLTLALAVTPSPAQAPARETAITNATGSLREWQPDAADPQVVYVRDRALRWYRVRLNGDCRQHRRYDAVRYTTDNANRFDRSSRVTFAPNLVCLVDSVQRSDPPPAVKRRR